MTDFGSGNSSQDLELHELNPEKGIVNIGSHPDNDIVLQDPRVMPFHMMLDYRQKPYRIIGLDPSADISIGGVALSGGDTGEVMDLSQVQFGGYSMVVKQQDGAGAGAVESLAVVPAAYAPQARQILTTPYSPAVPSAGLPAPTQIPDAERFDIPFRSDDIILVEGDDLESTIDVEQTASYQVTVINGGPIVATFNVAVEGVPDEWLNIQPQSFNLNEGGRATVEFRITPPRESSSTAKGYPLSVKVTSPNYPSHYGAMSAGLTINPFYEYSVGNLSPRASGASWRKHSATAGFPITNQGNSPAQFLVSAQDEENGCKFEYQLGDEADQVKQAEIKVEAGETTNVPFSITPTKRSLVRMRGKNYFYSIATQSLADPAGSRTISGSFVSRPLFGLLSMILIALLLVIGAYFLLRPRIIDFSVAEDVIELGDPAILSWKVTPFTTNLRIEGVTEEISGSQNQIEVFPTESVATYTLVGGNWLSRMLRMDDVRSTRQTVLVIPPSPVISTFFVDQTEIFEGDDITMKWSVRDADEVFLTVDGVMNTLTPEEFNGERTVTLRNDSLVILEAKNASGSVIRSAYVHAQKPSILIEEFTLSKTQIFKGEEVTISWHVSGVGVESVMIAPFEDALPLKDQLTFFPDESMEFVLTVKNRDLEEIRLLPVGVLPPGAEPEPPSVEFFKVAPEELNAKGNVEFSWSVSGAFTKIEITNLEGVVVAGLTAQGFKAVEVGKTTSFVLTAYNGDLSSAAILEVKVSDKKAVFIEINKIIPTGTISRGDSVIVYYTLQAVKDGVPVDPIIVDWPELSGSVTITDGFDTCTAALPQKGCSLTLNTSETNKQITATYSGDDNYVRRTSDAYIFGIDVVAKPSAFEFIEINNVSGPVTVVVGQTFSISVEVKPTWSGSTDIVSGQVKIFSSAAVDADVLCIIDLVPSDVTATHGVGSCDFSFPTVTTLAFPVKYQGNEVYERTDSSTALITVSKADTVPVINAAVLSPTVVGETFSAAFTVGAVAPGSGIPTGTVRVSDDNYSADYCEARLDSAGAGACNLTLTQVGIRNVIANYYGDGNYNTSSEIVAHPVNEADTSIDLTSFAPATGVYGQTVTVYFDVDVDAPGSGDLDGTVDVAGSPLTSPTETCSGTINTSGAGQCDVTLRQTGTTSFTANYRGDSADFIGSSSASVDLIVVKANTVTTIINFQIPSTSPAGASVNVQFVVNPNPASAQDLSGTVVVNASTGESCGPVSYPAADYCNIIFANKGVRTITATFQSNTNYNTSTSTSVSHEVKSISTTTVTLHSPNPSYVDGDVMITFLVTPVYPTPNGTVTVNATTGESCGPITLPVNNCTITFTLAGTPTVTATYSGDINYSESVSTGTVQTINVSRTSTIITSTHSSASTVGSTVNVAVDVDPTDTPDVPSGSVTITTDKEETCTIASVDNDGIGSCNLQYLHAGARTITATYNGETNRFATSFVTKNQTVAKLATTCKIDSDIPARTVSGESVTVDYTVSTAVTGLYPTTGTVTVKSEDSTTICTDVDGFNATGQGSCSGTIVNVPADGTDTLRLDYLGNSDFLVCWDTENHSVNKADVNISKDNEDPVGNSVVGEPVIIDFTVSAKSPGAGTPTGTVTITATRSTGPPNTKICDANLSSGTGSCTFDVGNSNALDEVGSWDFDLDYGGDPSFNAKTNFAAWARTVDEAATTIVIFAVYPQPVTNGQTVTVSFGVAITSPGGGTPTGDVVVITTIYGSPHGATCIVPVGDNECFITTDSPGLWRFTAIYDGDSNFTGSFSDPSDEIWVQ